MALGLGLVNDSVENRDKFHLWLWWTLAIVALEYGSFWLCSTKLLPVSN